MANSFKSLIKTGFGLGIGVSAAQILIAFIGMLFFIPGYLMYMKQEKEDKESSEKIISFVLMGLGVIMMGGIGFSILMESLGDLE